MTDKELMDKTLAILKRHNIYAVTSGSKVEEWQKAGGDRIIPGLLFNLGPDAPPPVKDVKAMFVSGRYKVLGEVGIQYQGIDPAMTDSSPTWRWLKNWMCLSASTLDQGLRGRHTLQPISTAQGSILLCC